MTFEERVKTALADLHFANLQLMHQVHLLKEELAAVKKPNGDAKEMDILKELAKNPSQMPKGN